MKKVGIWIDKEKAKIVSVEGEEINLITLNSEIETFHVGGGSGTRLKGGPQDVVHDSKYLEREKHQLAEYFQDITLQIADADSIVIFGPAQAGEEFYKELLDDHSHLHAKKIAVKKANKMTDNQIIAWVKDYFKIPK